MKKNKKHDFMASAIRIKEAHDLSDQEMDFVPELVEKRDFNYRKGVAKKYGRVTYTAAAKWWQGLSPREKKATGAEDTEEIIKSFLENNPGEADSKTIRKAIVSKKIKNDIFDSIADVDRDEVGNIVPAKKIKVQKKPPRQPTKEELAKMSLKEIGDLIIQTKNALWPDGAGAEQIPGLDSISESK